MVVNPNLNNLPNLVNSNETNNDFKNSILQIQQRLKSIVGNDPRHGQCYNGLISLDNKANVDILLNYVLQYKHENNISNFTLVTVLLYLLRFARKINKSFADMTREDVTGYLKV